MLAKLGNTLMTNWLAGWHGNGHGADVTCDKVTPLTFEFEPERYMGLWYDI